MAYAETIMRRFSVANRFFTLDGGIWNPTQLEREILRLRVGLRRLARELDTEGIREWA